MKEIINKDNKKVTIENLGSFININYENYSRTITWERLEDLEKYFTTLDHRETINVILS